MIVLSSCHSKYQSNCQCFYLWIQIEVLKYVVYMWILLMNTNWSKLIFFHFISPSIILTVNSHECHMSSLYTRIKLHTTLQYTKMQLNSSYTLYIQLQIYIYIYLQNILMLCCPSNCHNNAGSSPAHLT